MATTVLIADDHQIMREGLKNLIDQQDGMQVIGEAGDGRRAVELTQEHSPNVVIMDVSMPGLNGIEATRQIKNQNPATKVLALSVHPGRHFVSDMLKAGAAGYLLKNCAFKEMKIAIDTLLEDHTYLSPGLTDVIVEDYVKQLNSGQTAVCAGLSSREREVLQLIAEGNSTKQIAQLLHVSAKTVATHREHIMSKLSIHNVVDLTKYAVREGLTSFEL
ncbi:MAG: response regulator transcription factor [Phycisphaerae bacterium]|nr:response regulator transcription factor [Phycisphaerae bacterium]